MKALCAVPCLLSSVASLTRSLFFRELVFQRKSNLWHFFFRLIQKSVECEVIRYCILSSALFSVLRRNFSYEKPIWENATPLQPTL